MRLPVSPSAAAHNNGTFNADHWCRRISLGISSTLVGSTRVARSLTDSAATCTVRWRSNNLSRWTPSRTRLDLASLPVGRISVTCCRLWCNLVPHDSQTSSPLRPADLRRWFNDLRTLRETAWCSFLIFFKIYVRISWGQVGMGEFLAPLSCRWLFICQNREPVAHQ